MKIKEIDRTANVAWSPAVQHPIYLAAGTAAQQLDATFSTVSSLELYDLNLGEPGYDMCMKGSVVSNYRFHKIIWGSASMKSSENANGIIAAGADGGNLLMYDAAKILSGQDAILFHKTNHSGAVQALDFNKFQECLLATGANDSEIFIWDLNNPSTPMTPGTKSQSGDDVTSLAWNCQVQYILASTFPGRCVVWDLRKNEPIIKVSDSTSKMRCRMVAWHPEVATQLCIASDDDHSPLIQLWDLRFATTPVRNLERHQRGILSIAWCPHDPDLLLSCGKENKIFCWNPNSPVEGGEVLCELPTASQWSFDISWCLRNPAVIASSSCDGHINIYSLMGGQQQPHCSSKIAESFPGSEKMCQPLVTSSTGKRVSLPLQKPPKWMRKPTRASFGFGGKLVYFVNEPPDANSGPLSRSVFISRVVTEPWILKNTLQLETALKTKNFHEFCESRIKENCDKDEKMNWTFLQAMFSSSPRAEMLSLLGFDDQQVKNEVSSKINAGGGPKLPEVGQLSQRMSNLLTTPETSTEDKPLDGIAEDLLEPFIIETQSGDVDSILNRAILIGDIDGAVELCIQENRWADALVLAQAGGSDLLHKTQKLYFKSVTSNSSKLISTIGSSDWASLIKNCDIDCWKECFAAILTYAKQEEFASLCELLGSRLESTKNNTYMKNSALCYISSGNFEALVKSWAKLGNSAKNIATIQCLIEQVTLLRSAVVQLSGTVPPIQSSELCYLFGLYISILSSEGNMTHATMYLTDTTAYPLLVLQDRLYRGIGLQSPCVPFQIINVQKTSISPYSQESILTEQKLKAQQQTLNYGNNVPYSRQSFSYHSNNTYQSQANNIYPTEIQPQSSNIYQTGSQLQINTAFQTGVSGVYQPPVSSVYQPPTSSVYQPPTSSVYQPPTSSVYQPPTSSVYQPPTSSVYQPPTSSVYQPQTRSVYQSSTANSYQHLNNNLHQSMNPSLYQPASTSVCPPPSGNICPPPSTNVCPPPSGNMYLPPSSNAGPPHSGNSFESMHSNVGQLPKKDIYKPPSSSVYQPSNINLFQANNDLYGPPIHSVPPTSFTPPVNASCPPPPENINPEFPAQLSQRYPKHVPDYSVYSDNASMPRNLFATDFPSQQANYSVKANATAAAYSSYPEKPYESQGSPPFSEPMPVLPTSYGEMKTGWNDPPLLKQRLGTQVVTSTYETQPITVPLAGVPVPDCPPVPSAETSGYFSGTGFSSPQNQQNLKEPVAAAQMKMMVAQEKIEPPKAKLPIPSEHQVLQTVFEDLRHQCMQMTTNPQVKRKLEDVARKLELLYDQMRENMLSQSILGGLHEIIQAILQKDYQTALGIHGHIVSTTNFSEISGFMPGVKVLLQTASQLGVFLQ